MCVRLGNLLVILLILPGIVKGKVCSFQELQPDIERIQKIMYSGDIHRAANEWSALYPEKPCPLVRGYLANALFWMLIAEKSDENLSHDTLTRFQRVTKDLIHEADSTNPSYVNEGANAFAYAWGYILRAQWNGFQHRWWSLAGDIKKGKIWLDHAYRLAPQQGEVIYLLGLYNYVLDRKGALFHIFRWLFGVPAGDKTRAWPLLLQAARQPSGLQSECWMILGAFYQDEGRWLDSLAMIRRLRDQYPDNPMYHFWEGLFYERIAVDYPAAHQIYQEIWDKTLSHNVPLYDNRIAVQALYRIGFTEYKMYKFRDAIKKFQTLEKLRPADPPWVMPKSYLVLGDLYRDLGNIQEAKTAYAKVMQFPPVLDYRERAAKALHTNFSTPPWSEYSNYVRAKVKLAEGDVDQGCSEFEKVLKFNRTPMMQLGFAECLNVKGQKEKARQLLKALIDANTSSDMDRARAGAALLLGNSYFEEHASSPALKYYKLASKIPQAPSEYRQHAVYRIQILTLGGG